MDKLPWDLSVLTNLQELDLSMNLYTMVPDQCIWKGGHLATSLTKLSMNQNRIGQLPNEICEMKKLHTLCCYDNSLTALPRTLHEIDNLTQLSIYNNFITELPAEFARCLPCPRPRPSRSRGARAARARVQRTRNPLT